MVFLCIAYVGATQEKTIDKSTFDKLLNYWNCKYTEAYLNEVCKNGQSVNSCANAKKALSKCTDIENALEIRDLTEILKNNLWNNVNEHLSQKYFNNRKDTWKENLRYDEMLTILILQDSENSDIFIPEAWNMLVNTTTTELTKQFKSQFPTVNPERSTVISKQKTGGNGVKWWKSNLINIIFGLSTFIILIIAGFYYRKKVISYIKQLRKIETNKIIAWSIVILMICVILSFLIHFQPFITNILLVIIIIFKAFNLLLKMNKRDSKKEPGSNIHKENMQLKKDIEELNKEKENLQNRKTNLSELREIVASNLREDDGFLNFVKAEMQQYEKPLPIPKPQQSIQPQYFEPIFDETEEKIEITNLLYANFIHNNEFQNIVSGQPNDLSVFEIHVSEDGKTASFQVFIGAEERVISRPNYLAGCEKEIISGGTQLLQTPGKALEAGGKWIVDKPLKVKII